ncbi:MAG: hypothetical protein H6553_06135 [Chitinophagales bacterium]|nr:hypothetical protein [Romboutsia sp.]MCB9033397.1 hypothetical protein [Chitinophagales bacterium]
MVESPLFNDLELSFLELSKSQRLSEEDVNALKVLWAKYFYLKTQEELEKVWKEKNYSDDDIEKWIKGE